MKAFTGEVPGTFLLVMSGCGSVAVAVCLIPGRSQPTYRFEQRVI